MTTCRACVVIAAIFLVALPLAGQAPAVSLRPVETDPDTIALSDAERRERFPRVFARLDRRLGVILFREDITATNAPDIDELFRTVPAIRTLLPGQFVMAPDATPCGPPLIYVDGRRTPAGTWETNRHRTLLAQFVDLESIEILEVHRSAELIAEPFLRFDIAAAPAENENYPGPLGGRASPRSIVTGPPQAGTCVRVVLIWTPQHRPSSE